jgi:hypothetical protein
MAGDDSTTQPSILRLRFPDGEVELRWNSNQLPVGVLVRSRGALWRVSRYDDGGAVILDVASPAEQAQYGPVVRPTPLGDDESVLLETIVEI